MIAWRSSRAPCAEPWMADRADDKARFLAEFRELKDSIANEPTGALDAIAVAAIIRRMEALMGRGAALGVDPATLAAIELLERRVRGIQAS